MYFYHITSRPPIALSCALPTPSDPSLFPSSSPSTLCLVFGRGSEWKRSVSSIRVAYQNSDEMLFIYSSVDTYPVVIPLKKWGNVLFTEVIKQKLGHWVIPSRYS